MLPTGNQARHPNPGIPKVLLYWQNRAMSSTARPPIATVRGLLASLTVAGGALHLAVAPGRSADWRAEGLALASVGAIMIAVGASVALRVSRTLLVVTSVVNSLVIVALVGSRIAGYPFGPWESVTPSMGPYEIIVTVIAVVTLALALGALVSDADHLGATGWRFENLAPMAVVLVALPGLVTTQWADDAAHIRGSAHSHDHGTSTGLGFQAPLTADERTALGQELTIAAEAVEAYPTLGAARDAGWVRVGGYVSGAGQMLIDPDVDSRVATFEFDRPSGLLYESSVDEARLVGIQYNAWTADGSTPVGFTGQSPMWHLHDGTCVAVDDTWALPLDETVTGVDCSEVDATLVDTSSWMLRVWLVRGWENPAGTFAHDHSALP